MQSLNRSAPWLLAALLLACAVGCAERRVVAPPPAPAALSPEDAIPGDLDVALRLDVARMRQALGDAVMNALRQRATESAAGDSAEQRLIADLLASADTVWIALRPESESQLTDNVVVFEGEFAGFEPSAGGAQAGWKLPLDLGGGWRLYERPQPPVRSAPARIYVRADEIVVLVSTAEIDSVERALEQRAGDAHLQPARRGVISIEARPQPLARQLQGRAEAVVRLLARASRLRAHVDLDAAGLSAELELVLQSAHHAEEVASAAALLAQVMAREDGPAAHVAQRLQIEVVGKATVLRLQLDRAALQRLMDCASGGTPCGAPAPGAERRGGFDATSTADSAETAAGDETTGGTAAEQPGSINR